MRVELSSTRAGRVKVANDMWVIHLDTETEEMVPKYCPSSSQPGKQTSLHIDDVLRIPVECDATQVSKLWHIYFQWQPDCIQRKHEHGNARFMRQRCFLIAAMEKTNILGRTYISAEALFMDIRTSAVEEIVKNGSDIISGYMYFWGKYSDVSKAVKLSRSKVKQIFDKKCVPFDWTP